MSVQYFPNFSTNRLFQNENVVRVALEKLLYFRTDDFDESGRMELVNYSENVQNYTNVISITLCFH